MGSEIRAMWRYLVVSSLLLVVALLCIASTGPPSQHRRLPDVEIPKAFLDKIPDAVTKQCKEVKKICESLVCPGVTEFKLDESTEQQLLDIFSPPIKEDNADPRLWPVIEFINDGPERTAEEEPVYDAVRNFLIDCY